MSWIQEKILHELLLDAKRGTSSKAVWRWLPLLIAALAFLAYSISWSDGPIRAGDSPGYLAAAEDLEDGTLDSMQLRTPGYPLFLLATGNAPDPSRSLVVAQLILFFAALLTLAALLRKTHVRGWLVALFAIMGSLPQVVQPAAWVLSENLAQVLLTFAMVGFVRGLATRSLRWQLAAGTMLAFLFLVRPAYGIVAPFLAIVLVRAFHRNPKLPSRSVVACFLALVLPTLVLAGWLAHYQKANFGSSSSPLFALSLGARTANYVEYLPEEYSDIREILMTYRDRALVEARHHRAEGYIHDAWPDLMRHYRGDRNRTQKELVAASLAILRQEPRAVLLEISRSMARYWEWTLNLGNGSRFRPVQPMLLGIHYANVVIFWLCAATILISSIVLPSAPHRLRCAVGREFRLDRTSVFAITSIVAVVLLCMVTQTVLGLGLPRFRLPSELLIVFVSCFWIDRIIRMRESLKKKHEQVTSPDEGEHCLG